MLITISDSDNPLYVRISEGLKDAILSGKLASGARLPSTRVLAVDLGVSRNTVALAYEQLTAEGYLIGRDRAAASVANVALDTANRPPRLLAKPKLELTAFGKRMAGTVRRSSSARRLPLRYDFRYGQPAVSDFPRDVWRKLLSARAAPSSDLAGYGPSAGHRPLRQALQRYLHRARGISCELEQIVIVSGAQQAFDLTARLLVDEGCKVAIENPGYTGSTTPFIAAGGDVLRIPVDENGLDVDRLCQGKHRPRVICVSPCHQFPTGVVMPLARRTALLEWACRQNAWVVEDDYASELRYVGRPIEALKALDRNDRVIHVGTFSKTLLPALRLAYVVLPYPLIGAFLAAKAISDRYTSVYGQEVLASMIDSGHFERYLRRACAHNSLRRQALVSSLDHHFGGRVAYFGENAGVHLLVSFLDRLHSETDAMIAKAARNGVGIYSAADFYDRPGKEAKFLFGYASLSDSEIRRGIRKLASLI